ncbi:MAG: hypothetical protein V3R98_08525, partial [Alphaproteobacteria bacterium]
VRTYVAIARALGLSPSVGAMQANFGTPLENRLVVYDAVTETYSDAVGVTEATIAAVKPGEGPKSGWETITELDVDSDGDVDQDDLNTVLNGFVSVDDDLDGLDDLDDDDNEVVTLLLP